MYRVDSHVSWSQMVKQAKTMQEREPLLSSLITRAVISHPSFAAAIAASLSRAFKGDIAEDDLLTVMAATIDKPYELDGPSVADTCFSDLFAITLRDPACEGLVHAFLNFKGFKALASHRIAHVLWCDGRKEVALSIQARCTELFAVDIHPAAKIGAGLMLDHATGVIIGETATVGTNCSFLHGVTLGSSGKDKGFRHPQVGNDVLIGCNAIVLGYIEIGDNCKIGSGSIVLKALPSGCTAVGNPARIVGRSQGTESAALSMDVALHDVITSDGVLFSNTWSTWADGSSAFEDVAGTNRGDLDRNEVVRALSMHFGQAPPQSFLDAAFATLGKDPQQATFNKKEYKALIKLFDILPKQKAFLASDVLSTHFEEFSKNVLFL